MQKTGTSELYAAAFLSLFSDLPPVIVLGAIILLTSISTQILSNNATAVLLLPIAISTALGIGVDPNPDFSPAKMITYSRSTPVNYISLCLLGVATLQVSERSETPDVIISAGLW